MVGRRSYGRPTVMRIMKREQFSVGGAAETPLQAPIREVRPGGRANSQGSGGHPAECRPRIADACTTMKITKRTQNRNSEVTQAKLFMKSECHFGAENEPKFRGRTEEMGRMGIIGCMTRSPVLKAGKRFLGWDRGRSTLVNLKIYFCASCDGGIIRKAPKLERFHQCCSAAPRPCWVMVFFDFWLRFGSVTGCNEHAPSPKPRQKSKILIPHRYIISVNALAIRQVPAARADTVAAQPCPPRRARQRGRLGISGLQRPRSAALRLPGWSGLDRGNRVWQS